MNLNGKKLNDGGGGRGRRDVVGIASVTREGWFSIVTSFHVQMESFHFKIKFIYQHSASFNAIESLCNYFSGL